MATVAIIQYRKTLLADGTSVFRLANATAQDWEESWLAGGGGDYALVRVSHFTGTPPTWITAVLTPQGDSTPTAIADADVATMSRSANALEADHFSGRVKHLTDHALTDTRILRRRLDRDIEEYALRPGQDLQSARTALAEDIADVEQLEASAFCLQQHKDTLGNFLDLYCREPRSKEDIETMTEQRVAPHIAFVEQRGKELGENQVITKYDSKNIYPPNATKTAKLDVIAKDPDRKAELVLAEKGKTKEMHGAWFGDDTHPDPYVKRPAFLTAVPADKFFSKDESWTAERLTEIEQAVADE